MWRQGIAFAGIGALITTGPTCQQVRSKANQSVPNKQKTLNKVLGGLTIGVRRVSEILFFNLNFPFVQKLTLRLVYCSWLVFPLLQCTGHALTYQVCCPGKLGPAWTVGFRTEGPGQLSGLKKCPGPICLELVVFVFFFILFCQLLQYTSHHARSVTFCKSVFSRSKPKPR